MTIYFDFKSSRWMEDIDGEGSRAPAPADAVAALADAAVFGVGDSDLMTLADARAYQEQAYHAAGVPPQEGELDLWVSTKAKNAALDAFYSSRTARRAADLAALSASLTKPAAPVVDQAARRCAMLAGCESALSAELAKRKPDQSEVRRLRANIERLTAQEV